MSRIEVATVGITEYEHLLRKTIQDTLGRDWEALRSLEVKPYIPMSPEEAEDLAKTKGLLTIRGFLSLNGETGKMLDMNMEMGLTQKQDMEIANELANQCKACVRLMKIQHSEEKPVIVH